MATVVVLTRARQDRARAGRPASARFTPEREHALAEALYARGHDVVMWWDEPEGPCLVDEADVVYLRAGGQRNLARAERLAEAGARVLSTPQAHRQAADKLLAGQVLEAAGLPTPMTRVEPAELSGEVLVAKPRLGQGGDGVVKLARHGAVAEPGVVFQPFLKARGHLRFTVVGGKVIAAERREPARGDFRANLAAGASTLALKPDEVALPAALAVDAASVLGLDLAGVDVLETDHGPVVLEVNPASTLWHPRSEVRRRIAQALAALA